MRCSRSDAKLASSSEVVAGSGHEEPLSDCLRSLLQRCYLTCGWWELGIDEHPDNTGIGYEIMKHAQPFWLEVSGQ